MPWLRLIGSALLLYVALLGLLWLVQRKLQYLPGPGPVSLPPAEVARGLSEVAIETPDGLQLAAWWWPGEQALSFVLLHGNAGHRGDRLAWMRAMHDIGPNVLVVDYRGYGGNQGSPTEAGLIRDGLAAVRWVEQERPGRVILVGESLGTGVAVAVAAQHPPAAMILHSSFPSLLPIAQRAYPLLPVGWLMRDRFDSLELMSELKVPVMFVHGDADVLVPPELGRQMFEAAPGTLDPTAQAAGKVWWTIPGAGHQEVPYVALGEWTERVTNFLRQNTLGP